MFSPFSTALLICCCCLRMGLTWALPWYAVLRCRSTKHRYCRNRDGTVSIKGQFCVLADRDFLETTWEVVVRPHNGKSFTLPPKIFIKEHASGMYMFLPFCVCCDHEIAYS